MKQYPKLSKIKHSQQGAVLLESLLAVLIFSLGVLALAGLQSAMIKNTDDAKYRAEAAFLAQEVISEIWLTGHDNLSGHIKTDDPVVQLPGGLVSVAVSANREVTVTVKWTLPGGSQHQYIANAMVEGIVHPDD